MELEKENVYFCGGKKNRTVENAREQYESYDSSWKKEFFDEHSGGYVVVHIEREKHSRVSGNERRKYEKELATLTVFAKNGLPIEMIKEDYRSKSPDVKIDGVFGELKSTKSAGNILKYARDAIRHKGAQVILFEFQKDTKRIRKEIEKLRRKGCAGYYFFREKGKMKGKEIVFTI